MTPEPNRPSAPDERFWAFFFRTFWRVFTVPFRAVRFAYRKISVVPPKHLVLMALIFASLIAITLVVFVKVTSQPAFCVTCHYMRPYFASWQESSHRDVHCTECHFPPGVTNVVRGKFTAASMLVNYTTGVYRKSKPWAEISDQSCLREGCHQTRLLEGKVPYKEGIIFDHAPHLTKDRRGKHLRCTSCHSQIVQGSHMTVTEETCFLCHFKNQPEGAEMSSCTWCHDAPVAADSLSVLFDHTEVVQREVNCRLCHGDMAKGDGDVPRERCSYCHAETGKLERYSETVELHQIHITDHKVECNHCHNTITHRSIARTGDIKPECQACHVDRHLDQYALFSGQGALGVDPMPSSMFHAGLGCKACHVLLPSDWHENPGLATAKAGPASCNPCHEEAYYDLYVQAKPILQRRISNTENRLRSLHRRGLNQQNRQTLDEVEQNIQLLKRGKPIHNLGYTDRILNEINRSLDQLEGKIPPPRALPDSTSERCIRCHYGQDEVTVSYQGKQFSHRNHVHNVQVGCATCHQEEKPHHGQLQPGSFCMDCHHEAAAVSCDPCHTGQRDLIHATGPFAGFDPDIMFEAGLTCRDCHDVSGTSVQRPDAANCENCHEPGYWDDYQEYRADISTNLEKAGEVLPTLPDSEQKRQALELWRALQSDGTTGAHNIIAAQEAVDKINELIESGETVTGRSN